MRIYLTGVAGFLGCHVAAQLLDRGHQVSGCDNLLTGKRSNVPPEVDWVAEPVQKKAAELFQAPVDVVVHCFPTGTVVGGAVPALIEDAEEVVGHDGYLHKVTEKSMRPHQGPLVNIQTRGTLPVRCTSEHPLLVVRPYRKPSGRVIKPTWKDSEKSLAIQSHYAAEPQWRLASDIQTGDFLVSPRWVPGVAPGVQPWVVEADKRWAFSVSELEPTEDNAWMLGLYAADGGTQGDGGILFTLSLQDDLDRLVAVWERLGLTPKVAYYAGYRRVVIHSATVARSFRHWFGKGQEKHLPSFLFEGWPIRSIVQGMVDGDGSIRHSRKGAICYDTISLALAEQLRLLLVSLGESPYVSKKRRYSGYPNAKQAYAVRWLPGTIHSSTGWWNGMYLVPVKTVDNEAYHGFVHNLQVEGSESYTVSGVAVHNCAAIARSAWGNDDDLWEQNVKGTIAAADIARCTGARLVHASSSVVHVPESSTYARTKEVAERVALSVGGTALRFGNIYGPGQSEEGPEPNVIASMRRDVRGSGMVRVDGDGHQRRHFLHVTDAARAMVCAVESPLPSIWLDVCSEETISILDIAKHFAVPITWAPSRSDPQQIPQDPETARWVLGWEPMVPLVEGLAEVTKVGHE